MKEPTKIQKQKLKKILSENEVDDEPLFTFSGKYKIYLKEGYILLNRNGSYFYFDY